MGQIIQTSIKKYYRGTGCFYYKRILAQRSLAINKKNIALCSYHLQKVQFRKKNHSFFCFIINAFLRRCVKIRKKGRTRG